MYLKSIAALALLTLVAPAVQAHAKLTGANPAANTVAKAPTRIELHFSEKLVPSFSAIDLAMTSMPGMKMDSPHKIAVKSSVSADGKTLIGTPAGPLTPGTYRLDYHIVSQDTHRIKAGYSFSVR
jgi:methionine-rich copper-binding protein CopC